MEHEPRNDGVRIPDLEIRIWCAGFDLLVAAFYSGRTPHDAIEIVTSIYDKSDSDHLVEALQEVIKVIRSDDWYTMDVLDTGAFQDKNSPPF